MRYSSSSRMIQAKIKRSSASPLAEAECSQKVICKPQARAASKGGIQLVRMLRKDCSLRSSARWSRVRSCGKIETERASKPRVAAEQSAENRFRAATCQFMGKKRTG